MLSTRIGGSFICVLVLIAVNAIVLPAQSGTSSAISVTVVDATGAAMKDVDVTATDAATHATRTARTDENGRVLFSEVNPGNYTVATEARGFARQISGAVAVEVGRTVTLNFRLAISAATQTVEVTANQALLSLDNPNTTSTLESKTIANLPNAGQDITFITQFAPGALMNTAGSSNDAKAPGGYGNVEFNGLPATSNGYILDGFDSNDPWLGLNIGLSTNLVIGLDALAESTVNTNSYAVDQGRYGASQVNYFTKSGSNRFHGDAYWVWNGSQMNAEDYFLHANDTPGNITPKPHSNVNQFGVSLGGPVVKNKLFFFAHYEGVRIDLPLVEQLVAPSPAYQQYVLSQLPLGGTDPITGSALPAEPGEVALYKSIFGLYRSTAGTPLAISSCPLDANGSLIPGAGSGGTLADGSGCANQSQESLTNSDYENLLVLKIDHTIDAHNSVWYRFQQDTGLQAAYTDPINPLFNAFSPQPQRTLVVGYTHLFSPNLVNQFNPGASWYSSIFEPNNFSAGASRNPNRAHRRYQQRAIHHHRRQQQHLPAGPHRYAMADQRQPDVDARPRHFKFGVNTRRVDTSDYDLGEGIVPAAIYNDLAEFTYGASLPAQPDLSRIAQRASRRRQSRPVCDGHAQAVAASHHHGRRAGNMEHRSHQPAPVVRKAGGLVPQSRSRH